jgi:hypothetical protein
VPSNPFGKFGPIVLLAVVQLVLVFAAPSTASKTTTSALGGAAGSYGSNGTTLAGTGGATGSGATGSGATGSIAPGAAATGAAGSGAAGPNGVGASTAPGSGGVVTASGAALQQLPGDRTHCVQSRQFDPAIDFYAPPCVPGAPGAAFSGNGGATWSGVSANQIEVVNYVADYGAEVDAILKAQGLYYNADQAKAWNAAYANFINSHYQLWGRKIHVDTVQGTCQTVPPDLQCLIPEMDRIVQTYHPYAVFWETTVCSQCFAELSRLHVVNFGGGGFSDAFHNDNAPYSYDGGESATRIQLQFADWWCHQMTSQGGTGRTAVFAGTQNPAENLRNSPRVLGVVSTNDPDNENTIQQVLYPALKRGCGETVTHDYFYAQDINTATQQSQTQEAKMNTPTNPATSIVCFCDPVAPQFGQNAYASDNYWPESILADNQTMDFDSNAQTYEDSGGSPSLACPSPSRGCPYDNTIGIGADDGQTSPANTAAVRVWNIASHNQPIPIAAATLAIVWNDYAMFASLLENAGPVLTPARMQAAAPQLGMRGGGTTGHALKGFAPGNWCWTQDVRVVYWDKHRTSPYNGKAGTYVQIEGGRFNLGQFPVMKEPPAPLPENRT